MRPEIEQILQGKFDYERGSLEFSATRIEIEILQDTIYEGTFRLYGNSKKTVSGTITTSDIRMECMVHEFEGNDEEIPFVFDSTGMAEGDVEKGEFFVVSSVGEFYLPYVVSIIHKVLESSMGPIRNLFHFANLAKTNWEEALALFYGADFVNILEGNDGRHLEAYLSLSKYPGNEQNMEEFLLEINKKQVVEYVPEQPEIQMQNIEQMESHEIKITKNGWGFTFLKIEIDGDFISCENSVLSEEHFMGNICRCQYYIHPENLHAGNNYGKILFSNNFTSFQVAICIKQKQAVAASSREHWEKERNNVSLMEYYQAFRTKKISSQTWLKETGKIIEKMLMTDETDIAARLYQAQLLITENRQNEAKWVLDRAETMLVKEENKEHGNALLAYYLYLTSLNSREESYVNKITDAVKEMLENHPDDWHIAWLLMFLSEDIGKSPSSKWLFLEQQFYRGANSPLFYIEAFLIVNASPSMLTKLDEFEIQVLNYGAKKKILGKELIRQFLYLMEKNREYHPILFSVLVSAYEMMGVEEILNAICTMLIKGNMSGPAYYTWYAKGVEANLRITRLYEYYMYSVDKNSEQPLPRIVLMYFNYNSNLDYETNAYLYANVYKNQDKYGELFESYRPQIESFVQEQIEKDHINKDLAYLYKSILNERMLTEKTGDHLAPLLFSHLITIETPGIRYVVVKPNRGREERLYPVEKGKAIVNFYTGEYTLSFEDAYKNRYMHTVSYTIEKLLLPTKMAKMIAPYSKNCIGLDIYLCDIGKESSVITDENVERYIRLMNAGVLKPVYEKQISVYLMQYFYDNDCIEQMDELLETVVPEELSYSEKNEIIKLFIIRGMNDKAYEWVSSYGTYGIDVKTLLRIVSRRISEEGFGLDELLLDIAYQCFKRGKYDVNVLKYLNRYFKGMSKDMRDIWQAAEAFEVDTTQLGERLLEQILYTGAYIGDILDVFESYLKSGTNQDLIHAFLAQRASDYFIKDKVIHEYVFEQILKLYTRHVELLTVEKLAVVKFYAQKDKGRTPEIERLCSQLIEELMVKDIFFPFFMEYSESMSQLELMTDKTFIEYKGNPNGKAVMHYVIEHGEEEAGEYRTEEMNNVFGGNYCKEFILFYGESLQYYIMEEVDGKEQLTESATVHKSDIGREANDSRFDMINDISISRTLQDYETVDELMETYYRTEYIIKSLFENKPDNGEE